MLDKSKLIQSFEEIIGWPYVSPGTNDRNGIDCSGAFVRAYKAQGASIYHGSNRIIRVHCRDAYYLNGSASRLEPGMAVFKVRADGQESSDYKPGGKYYNPDLVGNYYHIGLVASVNPLRIIHATTPAAKADTALGNWSWAGWLKDVDYGTASVPGDTAYPYAARVDVGDSDRGLNYRVEPDKDAGRVPGCKEIPNGAIVSVQAHVGDWAKVLYAGHNGYVVRSYLRVDDTGPTPEQPATGTYNSPSEAEVLALRGHAAAIVKACDGWLGVG